MTDDYEYDDEQELLGPLKLDDLPDIAVDHGFEPRSGKTKDYKIGICCFSAKYAALRRMSKTLVDSEPG
jgi:hypothetical protein